MEGGSGLSDIDHSRTGGADYYDLPIEIDTDTGRRAVLVILREHVLQPALLDRMPLARLEHGVDFIQAYGGGGPAAVSMPGKPSLLVQPPAQPVQCCQSDQSDDQTGKCHEEGHSHTQPTPPAGRPFPYGRVVGTTEAASPAGRAGRAISAAC